MTETPQTYQVSSEHLVVKTFNITMAHIAKLSDLAQRTGTNQSEIVRNAIDLLWDKLNGSNDGHEE